MVSGQGFDIVTIHQTSAMVRSLDTDQAQLQITPGAAFHTAGEWNEMDAWAAQETVLELKTPSCLCGGKNIAQLPEKNLAGSIFSSHIEEKPRIEGNH